MKTRNKILIGVFLALALLQGASAAVWNSGGCTTNCPAKVSNVTWNS